jgi:hypothetical protein
MLFIIADYIKIFTFEFEFKSVIQLLHKKTIVEQDMTPYIITMYSTQEELDDLV